MIDNASNDDLAGENLKDGFFLKKRSALLTAGMVGCVAFALAAIGPAIGQDAPESLLPPGFGEPEETPAPQAAPAPPPVAPAQTPAPGPVSTQVQESPPPAAVQDDPIGQAIAENTLAEPTQSLSAEEDASLDEDDSETVKYDVPAAARRDLAQVGLLTPERGGFAVDAFGNSGGVYLTTLLKNIKRPVISRWASIMLRRALLSRVNSPANVSGADWAAERAWLLLRLGEADAARMIVQNVDVGSYSPRLYQVAMQTYLASGDPAGICPIVRGGLKSFDNPSWKLSRAICASFSGEQSTASALLNRADRTKLATNIDLLLAEKTIGAGVNGRRAVTIKWDEVQNLNNWRFGLALATGVEPPNRLYNKVGRHVQGWRGRAPMLPINSRVAAADIAAGMGVFSNAAMVDLYSVALDGDVSDSVRERARILRRSYVGGSTQERLNAMKSLWTRSENPMVAYSAKVLTARAAARLAPAQLDAEDKDQLIGSMLTAGLDRNAAKWREFVDTGSDSWAMLAVGLPGASVKVDYAGLDQFGDNDYSEDQLKSRFLLASLAGLGRVSAEAYGDFSDDISLDTSMDTRWSKAIARASSDGEQATVILLSAVAMQGNGWDAMSPKYLFHIIQALKKVGLEPAARMIAAESIARS